MSEKETPVVAAKPKQTTKPVEQVKAPTPPKQPTKAPVLPVIGEQVPVPAEPSKLLTTILSTRRRHGSRGDSNFRAWLFNFLKTIGAAPTLLEGGSICVRTDIKSDTLFSSHIDTVHGQESDSELGQKLQYDPTFGHLFVDKSDVSSSCLGADDGAGVYVMLRMIEAKVPGTYIFAVGEEQGGIGSRVVLAKHKDLLDEFSRAVAFDRAVYPGTSPEVVYKQGGWACASVEASEALCKVLNSAKAVFEMPWEPSTKGSFTDTKIYAEVVPECFNLCVFYSRQHTRDEYLDVAQLEQLVIACKEVDWDALPTKRKAEVPYRAPAPHVAGKPLASLGHGYSGYPQYPAPKPKAPASQQNNLPWGGGFSDEDSLFSFGDFLCFSKQEIASAMEEAPELAAGFVAILIARNKALKAQVDALEDFMQQV